MNRAIKSRNSEAAVFSQLIPPDFRLEKLARCECTGAREMLRPFCIGHLTKGKEEKGGGRAEQFQTRSYRAREDDVRRISASFNESLRLLSRFYWDNKSSVLRIRRAKLRFCMRYDLRSPTNVSSRVTNLRIFSEHRLLDKTPLGAERHVSRNVSTSAQREEHHARNGAEKSFVGETRLPPLLWIDVPRIVRGITPLVDANTVAMNISPRDFANAHATRRGGIT